MTLARRYRMPREWEDVHRVLADHAIQLARYAIHNRARYHALASTAQGIEHTLRQYRRLSQSAGVL